MTRKKVYVAVLNQGTTSAGLETQLFAWMQLRSKDYEFRVHFPSYRPIPNNRNHIVKEFLEGDWDFLFMIDDDNPPLNNKNPFDMLDLNLPVVAGVYPGKDEWGVHFHVYSLDESGSEPVFRQYPIEFRQGLKKVDAIGTGLMIVRRDVLERMQKEGLAPFEDLFRPDGTMITNDDMAFCMKCKRLGIDVYAHWDYIGHHFKEVDLLWVANLVAYAAQTGKTNLPREKTTKRTD